jgi:outer membrane immunogenic protein
LQPAFEGLLMKKVWLRSAALAAFIAGSAQAADLKGAPIYKAVAPAYDWTGFYAGLNAGVGASQTNGGTDAEFPVTDRAGVGFAGGLQAGFNWQFAPNWVTGIEGDIGYLGIDRSFKNWITVLAWALTQTGMAHSAAASVTPMAPRCSTRPAAPPS